MPTTESGAGATSPEALVRARLAATEKPGVYLYRTRSDASLGVGRSYLGGLPQLPPQVAWPRHLNTNQPLHFLAQIDCAEINLALGERALPESGTLFFFADINSDGSLHEPAGWKRPSDEVLAEIEKRLSVARELSAKLQASRLELDGLWSAADALPGPGSRLSKLIGTFLGRGGAGRASREEALAQLRRQTEITRGLEQRVSEAKAQVAELATKWPKNFSGLPVVNVGSRVIFCDSQNASSDVRALPEDLPYFGHQIGKKDGPHARVGQNCYPVAWLRPYRVRTYDRTYVSLDPWIADYQARAELLLNDDIARINRDMGADTSAPDLLTSRHLMFGHLQDDNASPERYDEVMLLELASDMQLGFMFGDVSVLRFHVPQDDLRAGNFEAAFGLCY